MITVSVVIPAYNCADTIGETLDTVLGQTVPVHEVVVVNDGSPDTPALDRVLASYAPRVRVLKQANAGPSAARNTGIQAATGTHVAFLDADDLWEPRFIERTVARLQANPPVDLVWTDGTFFGEATHEGLRYTALNRVELPATPLSLLERRCTLLTSAVVVRRDLVVRAGGFHLERKVVEDLDLWVRLLKKGARFDFVPEPLVRRRLLETSLSADFERLAGALLRYYDALEGQQLLDAQEREALRLARARVLRERSREAGRKALIAGDYHDARRHLASAVRGPADWKIAAALVATWITPGVARRLATSRGT